MEKFKSGFVAIVGRTNVGKSSILNDMVGQKVAVVVNKPQTTRTAIKAIVNRENSQIIFTDTPGIHKPKSKLGNTMTQLGAVFQMQMCFYLLWKLLQMELAKVTK